MLHSAYMSSAPLRYQYAPQQDVIEFTPPDFVLVKYGTITTNFVPHKLKTFSSEDEARTWLYAAN